MAASCTCKTGKVVLTLKLLVNVHVKNTCKSCKVNNLNSSAEPWEVGWLYRGIKLVAGGRHQRRSRGGVIKAPPTLLHSASQ
jgi:hypothetical protein